MTFFANSKYKFLPIGEDGAIETEPFLNAAAEVIPFFDVLGSTAFSPVKSDISGNISKLRKKYEENREAHHTLQMIVDREIEAKTTKVSNSATDALLWLKRALEFILVFLQKVIEGEQDLTKAANAAYAASLKRYHGWIVSGIFSLAMKAVPYREDFIKALAKGASEDQVMADMAEFMGVFEPNVRTIGEFYKAKGVDSDATV
eukprot:scpid76336/ scgid16503/ Pleckstrin homology domain-containing family A member 8; Phosphatidylinositol-four-phosphate adapter protein 2; Serologically defined breast cancer antigen NY-BR-86